jgi:ribosome biogenesis GTPase / thiamine phosphate phosphatase
VSYPSLAPYGWNERWQALLADHAGCTPGRVIRHDGISLEVASPEGVVTATLALRLDPAPTVGDWVAMDAEHHPVTVLPRVSLLRRRSALTDSDQAMAANVDLVLLVCGVDRPVKTGRIQRGATLAWDAGATPVVVLTKAARASGVEEVAERVAEANPGVDVLITSAKEGIGLDALRALAAGRTVTMLGESGAGKSSLMNALVGEDVAVVGAVRAGDSKGRHTTTTRELRVLPAGGVLIDTPGIRAVGLSADPEAVAMTFADIDELASGCRFADCRHDTEPGCAVVAAVAAGELAQARLDAWRDLDREAASAALRDVPHEKRQRRKGRSE